MQCITYIERGIYQDAHSPEECHIIIYMDEEWTYTYHLTFDKDACLTHDKICEKIKENIDGMSIMRHIPFVLPFFIGGYLGQIEEESWQKLLDECKKKYKEE